MNRFVPATLFLAATCAFCSASEPAIVGGITQPSERRTLAFESGGLVAEVMVKEGDAVKVGDVLMKQESRLDEAEAEIRRIDAESRVEIDAAEKEFQLRKVQYERKAGGGDAAYAPAEVEEARITMEVADLKRAEAKNKHDQAVAVYNRSKVKLELMRIVSQIDGIVEKISVDPGEMADPQKQEGAISIVKNDPVWVEVPLLKAWQVARLSPGQELPVRYTVDKADAWQSARIIFIAPVADARSGTQSVRLEMPNPQGWASGLDVEIKLPAELLNDPTVMSGTAARN
ncbi:MAG TPA: efflux RND transporter periplasmic adaptor subunit [Tepidisphaeraceae bacterium]|nr:efflux RND transporter periplasmic adaptor subunit [Tepidisphaeraceae bacterium]